MSPFTWRRLRLSKEDISIFNEESPSFSVWQSMILHDFPASLMDMKLDNTIRTTNSLRSLSLISKRAIFEEFVTKQNITNTIPRLCLNVKSHIPFLPQYTVSADVFKDCAKHIVHDVHYRVITCSDFKFKFMDAYYVPTERESESRICISRIIPEHEFSKYPRSKHSIAEIEPKVRLPGNEIWVILPESIFVCRGVE